MKIVIFIFFVLKSSFLFSQEKEVVTAPEVVVHVRERPTEKPGNPRGGHGQENQKSQGSQPNPTPELTSKPNLPVTLSLTTIKMIALLKKQLNLLSGIQAALTGSILIDFISDNPPEVIATVISKATNGDYVEIAKGLSNIGKIKQKEIEDIANTAKVLLHDEFEQAKGNKDKINQLNKEEKFWEALERGVNNVMIEPTSLYQTGIGYIEGPVTLSLYEQIIKNKNGEYVQGIEFMPSLNIIVNGVDKEIIYHVSVEWSRDSAFGLEQEAPIYKLNFEKKFSSPSKQMFSSDSLVYWTLPFLAFTSIPNDPFLPSDIFHIRTQLKCYINDFLVATSPIVKLKHDHSLR